MTYAFQLFGSGLGPDQVIAVKIVLDPTDIRIALRIEAGSLRRC